MRKLYWLDDEAWARIEPHLPRGRRGARRVDDRRVGQMSPDPRPTGRVAGYNLRAQVDPE